MLDVHPDSGLAPVDPSFSSCGAGLSRHLLPDLPALIVSKRHAGFTAVDLATLTPLIGSVARSDGKDVKFLVFDFAHVGADWAGAAEGFEDLTAATAELVVDAPVITVAWTRGFINGRDLEFAMNCAIVVAERDARFSFGGDPFELFGVYAAMARKIGFVRAERLIEAESPRSAEELRDLMIVKDVVEPQPGFAGIAAYLSQIERRYNASQAIYRAQRMAEARQPGPIAAGKMSRVNS